MERRVFHRGALRLSVAMTGSGQPFVFQHGLCGAAAQPAEVFPNDIGWSCLTLECRGHGLSDQGNPKEWSLATFTDDLAAFIETMDAGPVMVGGISMGAAIALALAVRRPDLVLGLVIARPAWIDGRAPDNLAPNREVARLMEEYAPEEALRRFDDSPTTEMLRRDAPDNLVSLRGFFSRDPIAETQALLAAIASDGPGVTRNEIANLNCRALVIGHARDAIHPLVMAREIANLIPQSQFVEITPKADNTDRYRREFQDALGQFMTETA